MAYGLPNPEESAPPVMGETPPDRQEGSLEYHASMVVAIVSRDGQLDRREMQIVGAMLQAIKMVAEGRTQNGEPGAMAAMAQEGAQPPGAPPMQQEPYMSHVGQTKQFGG